MKVLYLNEKYLFLKQVLLNQKLLIFGYNSIILNFFYSYLIDIILAIKILLIVVTHLMSVAFYSLADRKGLASVQRRLGPNVVGLFGTLQPFADGLKLAIKEALIPAHVNHYLFLFAPIFSFSNSYSLWSIIPVYYNEAIASFNYDLLILFALSSLNVYGIILAGWSSNSRYAYLGALRSASQLISYEITMSTIALFIVLFTRHLSLKMIVFVQLFAWNICIFFELGIIFLILILAETNRIPFDLPEGEAELVAGFFTEFVALGFALFFLSEYSNMLLYSTVFVIFFLGGWNGLLGFYYINAITTNYIFFVQFFFVLKIVLIMFIIVLIRAVLPRYRYDLLMTINWVVYLPFLMCFLIYVLFVMKAFDLKISLIYFFNIYDYLL